MATSFEIVLPVEIWQQILLWVAPADLCNVMTTSKHMNSVASWPDLWAAAGIKINNKKIRQKGLAEFYSINRFSKITKLDFSRMKFTPKEVKNLLNDILESPLENINLSNVNLRGVPAELLAQVVAQLRTVNLDKLRPDSIQGPGQPLVKIFEASLTYKTTLANLSLAHVNLSQVPAQLLASAICRLRTVNLSQNRLNYLTSEQCVKIVEAIISSTTLVDVDLSGVNLIGMSPKLLARAVSKLQTIKMNCSKLTTDQCVGILEASSLSETLTNLDLSGVNLGEVSENGVSLISGHLMKRAVFGLKNVSLQDTGMIQWQSEKILEAAISSNTLVSIDLKGVDLRKVPSELLWKVSRLKIVNLFDTQLTADQCIKVLDARSSSNTLANVNLRPVNLSQVPAELASWRFVNPQPRTTS